MEAAARAALVADKTVKLLGTSPAHKCAKVGDMRVDPLEPLAAFSPLESSRALIMLKFERSGALRLEESRRNPVRTRRTYIAASQGGWWVRRDSNPGPLD